MLGGLLAFAALCWFVWKFSEGMSIHNGQRKHKVLADRQHIKSLEDDLTYIHTQLFTDANGQASTEDTEEKELSDKLSLCIADLSQIRRRGFIIQKLEIN